MKTLLVVVLVIAVAAVFVNDVGRYARTRYDLDMATNEITDEVASFAGSLARNEAAERAAKLAQERGVVVYQYNQDGQGVYIWTQKPVEGTWALRQYAAWRGGEASSTPYLLRDYAMSVYR